jgi:hypothetical protein
VYLKSLSINIFRQVTRRPHIAARDPYPSRRVYLPPPSNRPARRRVTAPPALPATNRLGLKYALSQRNSDGTQELDNAPFVIDQDITPAISGELIAGISSNAGVHLNFRRLNFNSLNDRDKRR